MKTLPCFNIRMEGIPYITISIAADLRNFDTLSEIYHIRTASVGTTTTAFLELELVIAEQRIRSGFRSLILLLTLQRHALPLVHSMYLLAWQFGLQRHTFDSFNVREWFSQTEEVAGQQATSRTRR